MHGTGGVGKPAVPTFVLGAGCAKGGTTWLHAYLTSSPQCAPGFRKEYHVFDSIDVPDQVWIRARILERARRAVQALDDHGSADATVLHQAAMIADPAVYFDYFAALLARQPDARFSLDMTPNHQLLGAARFRAVREAFADRGIRTVSVFLMRDPVERIWSQLRMQDRRRPEHLQETAESLVLTRFAQPAFDIRSRYERTLRELDAAFEPGDVHLAFYERLFDRAELARICDLVGIDFVEPDFDARYNSSPKTAELPESTARAVAAHFRETYEYVAERFPDVDLPALWPSSRYVL